MIIHILLCIPNYVIRLHKIHIFIDHPIKLVSSPIYQVFLLGHRFETAYTKLTTLYKMSNRMECVLRFCVNNFFFLHEYLIQSKLAKSSLRYNQSSKTHQNHMVNSKVCGCDLVHFPCPPTLTN